jgi:hypothetical protein
MDKEALIKAAQLTPQPLAAIGIAILIASNYKSRVLYLEKMCIKTE